MMVGMVAKELSFATKINNYPSYGLLGAGSNDSAKVLKYWSGAAHFCLILAREAVSIFFSDFSNIPHRDRAGSAQGSFYISFHSFRSPNHTGSHYYDDQVFGQITKTMATNTNMKHFQRNICPLSLSISTKSAVWFLFCFQNHPT